MSLLRCFCFCGWATQKLHRPRVSCVGIYACVPFAFGGSSPTPSPSRRHRPLTPEASHLIDVVTHNAICCCLQCWPPLLRFYRARSRSLCSTAGISLRSGSPMKRKRFSSGEGTLTGVKRYIVDMYVIVLLCVFCSGATAFPRGGRSSPRERNENISAVCLNSWRVFRCCHGCAKIPFGCRKRKAGKRRVWED